MKLLLPIASALSALFVVFVFHFLIGLELDSMMLFFVIPLGGFVVGMLACYGYPKLMVKLNIKSTPLQLGIQLLIGLLVFISIHFLYYQMTYIDESVINYRFKGVHISEYLDYEMDIETNFLSYTLESVDRRVYASTRYYIRKHGNLDAGSIFNRIMFVVQFLGFMFGSWGIYKIILKEQIYCEQCQHYMKRYKLFKLAEDDQKTLEQVFGYFHHHDINKFVGLLKTCSFKKTYGRSNIIEGVYFSCDNHGTLVTRNYMITGRNSKKYIENSIKRYRVNAEQTHYMAHILANLK